MQDQVRHPHPGTVYHVLLNGDIKPSQIYMKFNAMQLPVAQTPSGEITKLNDPLPLTTFASIPSLNPLHRFLKAGDILYAVNALSTMGWPYEHVVGTILERSMPVPLILQFLSTRRSNATESLVQLVLHPYLTTNAQRTYYSVQKCHTNMCEEIREGLSVKNLIDVEGLWKGSAEWVNRYNHFASASAVPPHQSNVTKILRLLTTRMMRIKLLLLTQMVMRRTRRLKESRTRSRTRTLVRSPIFLFIQTTCHKNFVSKVQRDILVMLSCPHLSKQWKHLIRVRMR